MGEKTLFPISQATYNLSFPISNISNYMWLVNVVYLKLNTQVILKSSQEKSTYKFLLDERWKNFRQKDWIILKNNY
jgi:hypothetical protein